MCTRVYVFPYDMEREIDQALGEGKRKKHTAEILIRQGSNFVS